MLTLQEPPGSDSMYDSDYNDAGSDMVPGMEQREQSEDVSEQPEPAAEVDGEWGELFVTPHAFQHSTKIKTLTKVFILYSWSIITDYNYH